MQLPKNIEKIMAALKKAGFESYCVGGCVRDSLLSLPISDYDITTSALPDQTAAALIPIPVIDTGIKHGTVTAIIDGTPIEITTFRSESGYTDHRHPDSVTFSKTLKSDLSRRDFTVNALAFSKESGIIDLFGGIDDLNSRLIRCVGDPYKRFSEDALRILRALRFAACLGFSIEEETARAIKESFTLLSYISKERIYSELCRLICGKNAPKILVEYFEIFSFIFSNQKINREIWNKRAHQLPFLKAEPYIRFAALLSSLEDSENTFNSLISLKADKNTASLAQSLVSALPFKAPKNKIELKKLMKIYSQQTIEDLALLDCAESFNDIKSQIQSIKESGECFSLSRLAIGGNELSQLGFKGRQIGELLDMLLCLVIEEKLENTPSALISYVKTKK